MYAVFSAAVDAMHPSMIIICAEPHKIWILLKTGKMLHNEKNNNRYVTASNGTPLPCADTRNIPRPHSTGIGGEAGAKLNCIWQMGVLCAWGHYSATVFEVELACVVEMEIWKCTFQLQKTQLHRCTTTRQQTQLTLTHLMQ